jgi:hypothetical protein
MCAAAPASRACRRVYGRRSRWPCVAPLWGHVACAALCAPRRSLHTTDRSCSSCRTTASRCEAAACRSEWCTRTTRSQVRACVALPPTPCHRYHSRRCEERAAQCARCAVDTHCEHSLAHPHSCSAAVLRAAVLSAFTSSSSLLLLTAFMSARSRGCVRACDVVRGSAGGGVQATSGPLRLRRQPEARGAAGVRASTRASAAVPSVFH